jgi:thiamine pyrophosphokinase
MADFDTKLEKLLEQLTEVDQKLKYAEQAELDIEHRTELIRELQEIQLQIREILSESSRFDDSERVVDNGEF